MFKLKKLLLFAGLCFTILAQLQISHINFKTMIAIKGQKLVSWDATQKGQIFAVLTSSKLRVYKLLSLDYYTMYAQHKIQYGHSLSVSDIKPNKNNGINNDILLISIIKSQNQLMVFKTQTQRQTLQLMLKFKSNESLISTMSEKKKFPFITLLTKSSVEIYQISEQNLKMELKKTYFFDKINQKFDQMHFDRVRTEIILSSHISQKPTMRIGSSQNQSIIFSHTNLSSSSHKIVDMSWSHNGVQLMVINQEGVELLIKKGQPNMLNRLIKDSREIINNILADRKDQTSRQNSITLQIDEKIKGITIDKSSKYVGYVEKSTLNLGELIRKKTGTQIKHIRSYNISKFCSPIVNYTKIMYVYQQRLLIPCYKDDEIRILIIHACQAQACSNFCGGPFCGDCIVDTQLLGEECDDCNNIDGDGCSATCLLEYRTQLQLIYIEKSDTENKLFIKLKISPSNILNWDLVDFSKILSISIPSQPISPIAQITYINLNDGNVLVAVVYSSDIQDKQMQVNLNTSSTGIYGLYTLNFAITPFDNEIAYVYDTRVYFIYATTKALGCVAAFGGLIVFVIGIIGSKLIGIQMMAVIQISYLSLIFMKSLNPGFNAISQLWFVNGYNKLRFDSSYLGESQSFKPKGLQLYPYFLMNYNLTMILIFLPILIGIVVLVLSRVWKSTLAEYWPRLFGEYAFNGIMFSAYIVWVSIGLEFMYGISTNNSEIGAVSVVFSIFFILVYLCYFILMIIKPQMFNQFITSFKEDFINKKVYLALIVERIVIGISLPLMLLTQFSFILVLVIYTILLICIILKRPYKNIRDNVRQISNFSIVIVIQIIYLCYNIDTVSNQNKLQIFMYLPIIVFILLIICVLYSAVALAYEIYVKIAAHGSQQEKLCEKNQRIQAQHINDQNETRRNMVGAAKQSGLYIDSRNRQIGPEKTEKMGKQEYKQSYEAASKIKKELKQNFGLNTNENVSESSPTKRQKILYDKQELNNYKQM